jgi:hypothetical protein
MSEIEKCVLELSRSSRQSLAAQVRHFASNALDEPVAAIVGPCGSLKDGSRVFEPIAV